MATIKFEVRSKKKKGCAVSLRFSNGKHATYRATTRLLIDKINWNEKKGQAYERTHNLKNLNTDLHNLRAYIFNENNNYKGTIDAQWLNINIDKYYGRYVLKTNSLIYWADKYLISLKNKHEQGEKSSNYKKFNTIKRKLESFEKHTKKEYDVIDVNLDFREVFINYLLKNKKQKLARNTVGRYLRFVKTICKYAEANSIIVSPQLQLFKGFTVKALTVTLNFEDLEKLKNKYLELSRLANARDWLLLGCHSGQRVSDLLNLTQSNIKTRNNLKVIELVQKKTKKPVIIPVTKNIERILKIRNGKFPKKISHQRFNEYIKEVCELAEINELIEGGKIDKKTKRKKIGKYPKHELITSHVMRRSFSTNYFGKMPTSYIIGMTGHSTEHQFMEYVGKKSLDLLADTANYFAKIDTEIEKNSSD